MVLQGRTLEHGLRHHRGICQGSAQQEENIPEATEELAEQRKNTGNLGQRLHQNPYRSHVRGNRTRGLLSHGRRGVQERNPQGLYAVDGFRRRTSTGGSAGFPDAY